jgi:hypothetical protein
VQTKQLEKAEEARQTAQAEVQKLREALSEAEAKSQQAAAAEKEALQAEIEELRMASTSMSEDMYKEFLGMHEIVSAKKVAKTAKTKLQSKQTEAEKEARLAAEEKLKDVLEENRILKENHATHSAEMQSIVDLAKSAQNEKTITELEGKLSDSQSELTKAQAEIAALKEENASLLEMSKAVSAELHQDQQAMAAILAKSAEKKSSRKLGKGTSSKSLAKSLASTALASAQATADASACTA